MAIGKAKLASRPPSGKPASLNSDLIKFNTEDAEIFRQTLQKRKSCLAN